MNMSPSSLYYKRVDWKKKDQLVLNKIKKFLEIVPVAGVPSVTSHLKKEMRINKKRVARIMKLNGLIGRKKPIKKRISTDSKHKFKKHENLVKDIKTSGLNQVVVGDVTAFNIKGTNYYLAMLMDLHNREIIGTAISAKNDTELVLCALEEAKRKRKNLKNCIHHTDADVRYCSDLYTENLMGSGIKISMCVGNVYENAFAESLNKTVKAGEINISDYETIEEAASSIFGFIKTYNSIRPHSSLNGMSPLEFASTILKKK
jgi:putative transposase